ncbi:hypothetical protein [Nocardia sp. NPDC059228]|uniref:hypothetical protein n=1 Tax=Nocardia sp. NPDC059228 TaxID=3346777 RepID=UPI00368EFEA5
MAATRRRPRRPKIGEAVALLKLAPNQIEADLQRYYPGRRIAEFWRTVGLRRTGEMTPRELVVLIEELPEDSRFKRKRSTAWTLLERLLAASINLQHCMREDYRSAHGADYHFTPIEAPELDHERRRREAREAANIHRRQLARAVIDRMLSGQLRTADIDVTKPIEEVLAA